MQFPKLRKIACKFFIMKTTQYYLYNFFGPYMLGFQPFLVRNNKVFSIFYDKLFCKFLELLSYMPLVDYYIAYMYASQIIFGVCFIILIWIR